MGSMRGSSISSWALLVAKALEAGGHDSEDVFRRAGLDPAKLKDADARYPIEGMRRLWRLAVQVTGDPYFGLKAAGFWHPTTMHALGYSWMASDSLRDALIRMTRYGRLVTTVAEMTLEEFDDHFAFKIHSLITRSQTPNEAIDAGLATLVSMCRMSYGDDFHPLRVVTQRPKFDDPAPYIEYFHAPVEFSASDNILYFSKDSLEAHLLTANPRLARVSDRVVTQYLAQFDKGSTAIRVRAKLIDLLSAGNVTQKDVADSLHMSLRTLQRKLSEERTSYKELLDETRRELANQYLRQASLSVSEVTYLLGFSEPSNFARAFKRWTGSTPSEFRAAA
ncbi:MAG: AraC family transcriptional regulator [Chloroflexi bacterium]|nr:MAG: AraC family transcriptional regulator [Chloroflexota bacterium]